VVAAERAQPLMVVKVIPLGKLPLAVIPVSGSEVVFVK
jgi:hypothetical protein